MNFLKIISFLPFLTQIKQKFGPKHPSNMAFLAILALNLNSGVCTTTTYCFKRYSPCKIWKKPIDIPVSLLFSKYWAKFCPKTTPTLIFIAGFQWNMSGDSININNFNWNPVVKKKKTLLPLFMDGVPLPQG